MQDDHQPFEEVDRLLVSLPGRWAGKYSGLTISRNQLQKSSQMSLYRIMILSDRRNSVVLSIFFDRLAEFLLQPLGSKAVDGIVALLTSQPLTRRRAFHILLQSSVPLLAEAALIENFPGFLVERRIEDNVVAVPLHWTAY